MTHEEAAQEALNRLAALLADCDIISFDFYYANDHTLFVVIESESSRTNLLPLIPRKLQVADGSRLIEFSVEIKTGSPIRPLIADASIQPPISVATLPAQGGDPCYINGSTSWGTAGIFFGHFDIEVKDRLGNVYRLSADNGFLSCNHVIADLDSRPVGTPLVATTYPSNPVVATATLEGFIPTNNILVSVDLAAAQGFTGGFNSLALRGLGNANPTFRNPADNGEAIRKSGARTGITGGVTTGRTIINAQGAGGTRQYSGIYITSENFSDHGDSGSIVIGSNNDMLGMIAWSNDATPPVGYFFTFGMQQLLTRRIA